MIAYTNPIISGFHPDPSVVRVGEDFYLVNSSFEYFPGIPLFHSKDLVNWQQIGHVLTRESQVHLAKGSPNRLGIYAPTIRYHQGRFYCVVTNVGGPEGNFYVYTDDISGQWSDPIYLPFEGIDPSLFFDDNGKVYYTGTDKGIFICEIDIETGKPLGEKHYESWSGTGCNNPEGPHLYRKDGYYYLMIAEGGTELCHRETIARSKTVFGPYESCPNNPVLTNDGTDFSIKAVGHADLVTDTYGKWWAVCLGIRPIGYPFLHILGRETMLVPVEWNTEGWPEFGHDGHCHESYCLERSSCAKSADVPGRYYPIDEAFFEDFNLIELPNCWNYVYNPNLGLIDACHGVLDLSCASPKLSEDAERSLLLRRQEHFEFIASVTLDMSDMNIGECAGLTIYLNNLHHYDIRVVRGKGANAVYFERRLGSISCSDIAGASTKPVIELKVYGNQEEYSFEFDGVPAGKCETRYLATEVGGAFTGNYIGLFAEKNDKPEHGVAHFYSFEYRSNRAQ